MPAAGGTRAGNAVQRCRYTQGNMDSQGIPGDTIAAQCERKLSDCGIRPTGQRVRIAALLLSAPQHLSAEQILDSLRAAGARVSKATVYNTLNLFAERGLIRQLSVDGSRAWFDSNVDAHYHFHDMTTGNCSDFFFIHRHFPLPGLYDPFQGKWLVRPAGDP